MDPKSSATKRRPATGIPMTSIMTAIMTSTTTSLMAPTTTSPMASLIQMRLRPVGFRP